MAKMTLEQAVEKWNVNKVAKALGMTPPSIDKALRMNRDITLNITWAEGTMIATGIETKPFPSPGRRGKK